MRAAWASSVALNARPSSSAVSIAARAGSPTSAAISAMRGPVFIPLYYHVGPVGSSANTSMAIEAIFLKPLDNHWQRDAAR